MNTPTPKAKILLEICPPVFPQLRKQLVELALANTTTTLAAAKWLGVSRESIYRWCRRHQVELPGRRANALGINYVNSFRKAVKFLLGSDRVLPVDFWTSPALDVTLYECKAAYRTKIQTAHPDKGGRHQDAVLLNYSIHVVETAFAKHGIK